MMTFSIFSPLTFYLFTFLWRISVVSFMLSPKSTILVLGPFLFKVHGTSSYVPLIRHHSDAPPKVVSPTKSSFLVVSLLFSKKSIIGSSPTSLLLQCCATKALIFASSDLSLVRGPEPIFILLTLTIYLQVLPSSLIVIVRVSHRPHQ